MQLSHYIVTNDIKDKGKLLFNCKTNKLYLLSNKYVDYFNKLMVDGNCELLPEDLKCYLNKWGLIASNAEEDYLYVKNKFDNIINSKNRLRMTILPTDACNFRCIYCCQSEPYHTMNKHTQKKVIEFIKKTAKDYKSIFLSWFGGEPLLALEPIYEISNKLIEYSKNHGKPYLSEITTNGYLLNVKTFLKLLRCRIKFFQITLDGTKEIHNKNRPHKFNNDSFERIYDNLMQIKKLEERFRIIIRLNITPEIDNILDEIIIQFKLSFSDDERFIFAVQPVRDWGGDRIGEYKKDIVRQFDFYDAKIDLFNKYKLKLWDMNFFNFGNTFCDANYEHSYIINPIGKLLRCSIAEYDEKYKSINCVGELLDDGEALLNQNDLIWRQQTKNENCKQCKVYPLCCRATCKLGFNISLCDDACKKDEIIQYLKLFIKNKYMRGEIDEQL